MYAYFQTIADESLLLFRSHEIFYMISIKQGQDGTNERTTS